MDFSKEAITLLKLIDATPTGATVDAVAMQLEIMYMTGRNDQVQEFEKMRMG